MPAGEVWQSLGALLGFHSGVAVGVVLRDWQGVTLVS